MKTTVVAVSAVVIVIGLFGVALAGERELLGAGATFPYPLYSKMFDTYAQEHGVKVNYQAIGSGGGIKQVTEKTVDFGGTDAFMSDEELKAVGAPIVHVPTCLGAVVLTYNVPVPGNAIIRLAPDIIADIFMGKIEKWNDPRLADINPDVKLPDMAIVVVHRSDGSGTTFIFSDYLGKVSVDWREKVGVGKSLNWPVGLGAKGNPGVAGLVKQLPGSIGYVELIYTLQNNMPSALVRNKAGNFIEPTVASVSAAASIPIPADTRVSITDTDAKDGYPISGFTWLVFYKEQSYSGRSIERARDLINLVYWIIHEGQQFAQPLHYSPLPKGVVAKSEVLLKSVTFNAKLLLAK